MAHQGNENSFSDSVTGPFHQITEDQTESPVNSINQRNRHYIIDFGIEPTILMLPISFAHRFSHEIDDYAILIDRNKNYFEMKVNRAAGCIFLTTGCGALRDFYRIKTDVWITLVYMGLGNFRIKKIELKNARKIDIPMYVPPMKFEVDRDVDHGIVFHGLFESIYQLAYEHNSQNFQINYEKSLQFSDINSGFLMLGQSMFREHCLQKRNVDLMLIDDNGNKWKCRVIVGSLTQANWRIGGQWKAMIDARNITHGSYMIIGAPIPGIVNTAFISFKPPLIYA